MKFKIFSVVALIISVLSLLAGIIAPILLYKQYISDLGTITLIGAAETGAELNLYSMFYRGLIDDWPFCLLTLGVALTVTSLFCLIFNKSVENNCNIKTSAISLGISAIGALGILCFLIWLSIVAFNDISSSPIAYSLSKALGIASFALFVILLVFYFVERRKHWSLKGFIIDIFTSVLYLPTFFFAIYYLCEILGQ